MQVRQLRNVHSRTANTKALSAGLGRRRASRRVGGRPRSSVVALVPRAAPAAPCAARPPSHTRHRSRRDRIRRRGEPRAGRPTVRPSAGPAAARRRQWRVAQSVSHCQSVISRSYPGPRAHPSTGSQSGSAAPVQPQVPSTNRVLAPPGGRGLLNDCGASRRGREVIVLSPSEQGVPCRFLPCTAGAGLC